MLSMPSISQTANSSVKAMVDSVSTRVRCPAAGSAVSVGSGVMGAIASRVRVEFWRGTGEVCLLCRCGGCLRVVREQRRKLPAAGTATGAGAGRVAERGQRVAAVPNRVHDCGFGHVVAVADFAFGSGRGGQAGRQNVEAVRG